MEVIHCNCILLCAVMYNQFHFFTYDCSLEVIYSMKVGQCNKYRCSF